MPNIKSAIKRVSVIEKKTLQNNMIKSEYKTAVKKFEAAVTEGNKENNTHRIGRTVLRQDARAACGCDACGHACTPDVENG